AAFKDSSGCGYINRKGDIVIRQQKDWDDLTSFINGYASYKCGGDWGVIDSTGKRILHAIYETPPLFYNGLAIIKENNKYGTINLKGNKVIQTQYHHIAYPFVGDRLYAKDGMYYIMIDKTGKQIDTREIYRIDLVSALQSSFTTGYIVIGEKLGISLSDVNSASSNFENLRSLLNKELTRLYND
ncbi:MAG: WG repeat-containing protein, partial [Bacteroidales bacterium]|nr:WG repeat-containing protein [Bacteroidales bacterium]